MAKFKITINEIVNFNHEMTVEAKSESELNKVLDKIEREANYRDDVDYILEEHGIKILDFNEDGSGEVNIEVPDLEEVE
ncbi:hypothetical protein [Clostridium perfringens]|uniref:Uncharacterized protein n=2 Tax=Clostridium perfringens TaxID=1502 RepID=A0AAP7BWA7_CLOPF|nr:hypothetical protein [Clostridium perfringens]NP_612869.1 Gp40 protein [Clostridium phage phi3626]AAL96810.1 Gp40 protein [Clostridium phage phi3626]EDT22890.1 conserved domain protein [Clostridium perfringens B str. ATCC 3626]NGU30624.1 hypothetical protein [Clostridium perfringens]WEV05037.1 hypothetical protein PL322_13795 [Clostridium perfringens B]